MAIVKFVTSGCPMNNIFPYVMNREKTDENLISGIGCSPDTVLSEFTFVKKQFKKDQKRCREKFAGTKHHARRHGKRKEERLFQKRDAGGIKNHL